MSKSDAWHSSYFLEERSKPLNHSNASLNETLQTEHLDVPSEDESLVANVTRSICRIIGYLLTPRQVLGLLRVLKAITLSFLVLSILSNIMYVVFVELLASEEVKTMSGGSRDIIIRFYGLLLSFVGLAVELDYSKVVKKVAGLKGFIPRALLYCFIVQITGSHPILLEYSRNAYSNGGMITDDEYAQHRVQIPSSAVGFQKVTSFVLGICALGYLVCGILCFDRFTARAFLSTKDPRVTTAIPPATTDTASNAISNSMGQASLSEGSTTRDSNTLDRTGDPPGW